MMAGMLLREPGEDGLVERLRKPGHEERIDLVRFGVAGVDHQSRRAFAVNREHPRLGKARGFRQIEILAEGGTQR